MFFLKNQMRKDRSLKMIFFYPVFIFPDEHSSEISSKNWKEKWSENMFTALFRFNATWV